MTIESMKALTLWQPWASLCSTGHKTHETRSWPVPATIVGRRIAIHAAKAMPGPGSDMMTPDLVDLCIRTFGSEWRKTLARSAIICTAIVEASLPTEAIRDVVDPDDLTSGIWTDGRFAWRLTEIETPASPIEAKGAQGLWRWRPDTVEGLDLLGRGPTPPAQGLLDLSPR